MVRGIGIDAIEIERVARVHARYGERFLRRVFSEGERAYIASWKDPVPRMAGRFAVKEACMKALGTGWSQGVRWRDIEVLRDPAGKPRVRLSGEAQRIFAGMSAGEIHCSITHSRDYAMAVVVFE